MKRISTEKGCVLPIGSSPSYVEYAKTKHCGPDLTKQANF